MRDISHLATNTHKAEAAKIRDMYKNYFLTGAGSVSWQIQYVRRGKQGQ